MLQMIRFLLISQICLTIFAGDVHQLNEGRDILLSEDIVLSKVAELACDKDGQFFILLDSRGQQILMVSPEGELIRTFGGKGQGPGEFFWPASLHLGADSKLYVSDPPTQKILIYGLDGTFEKEIRLPGFPVARFERMKNGDILATHQKSFGALDMSAGKKEKPLFSVIDSSGKVKRQIMREHRHNTPYVDAVLGDVFVFETDAGTVLVPAITPKIKLFKNFIQAKQAVLPLNFQPVEPTAEAVQEDGNEYITPVIDYLVQDATSNSSRDIFLVVNQKGTSHTFRPPQKILVLDIQTLKFKNEISYPGYAEHIGFLGPKTLMMVMVDDGEYRLKRFDL